MKHVLVLVISLFAAVGIGCGGSDTVSVEGSALFDVDGTATGFAFYERTHLADRTQLAADGLITGYCTVDANGTASAVGLARDRTEDEEGMGARSIDVVYDAEGFEIIAQLGGTEFAADALSCTESEFDIEGGYAMLALDCMLSNGEGDEVGLSAQLEFQECTVE